MFRSFLLLAIALLATPSLAAKPDLKATAEKLVGEVANVQEGQTVWISGNVTDAELASEIAHATRKRGAVAYVELDRTGMAKRYFAEVPAKFDAAAAKAALKRVPLEDVLISLSRSDDPTETEGVDPARLAARAESFKAIVDARMKKKVVIIDVGNGMFPTASTAKALGLSLGDLDKMFWAGINTDYKKLAARGAALKAAIAPGKELVVKNKAGTDIKLRLKPLMLSDGVISADDQKAGGAAVMTWLPAGEAYGLVEPASAEGKIVADVPYHGRWIKGVTFTVKAGKLSEIAPAKPSKEFDAWKAVYDAAPAGKEAFSIVDFGINEDVKPPKGKLVPAFVPDGSVTLLFGGDLWAGGTNNTQWGEALFLSDATVTVDGKVLVDNGALKLEAK
ncbi:MAG: aminopeptidase [Deltaproteobacteria bacterium]|nr:aminopeptidase [Deltaproteobacteria bacterium]